jgi:hypothetical protein
MHLLDSSEIDPDSDGVLERVWPACIRVMWPHLTFQWLLNMSFLHLIETKIARSEIKFKTDAL